MLGMKKVYLLFSLLVCLAIAQHGYAQYNGNGGQDCCYQGGDSGNNGIVAGAEYPCGDTICYSLCCRYKPKYYTTWHCDYVPKYHYKKCCQYVPQYYQKCRCQYVPRYYYETCCKEVPQYYYTCECKYCPKYTPECHCTYVPEYYYKKSCCQNNGCAQPCCDSNGYGNSNGYDNGYGNGYGNGYHENGYRY